VSAFPPTRKVAILGFHKIGDPPPGSWESWYLIPEETFVRQLAYLDEQGWQVIGLDDFLAGIETPHGLPERAALLTFDDGFRSIAGSALSRISEFEYPGVLFVPSDCIGGHNDFDADTDEPREPICNVEELRELARRNISVQSHAASHTPFSLLHESEQEAELIRSKLVLEAAVGRPVEALAYPRGDRGRNPKAVEEALEKTGYRAAFGYGGGPVELPTDTRYRLARIAMGPDTDLSLELDGR
jgi:peptidoglycan/xylan/chitin deacetylase (PgdA/CDA1 family)